MEGRFMKKEIKCGVYRILNIANNMVYVGSSKDIYYRWKTHKKLLNKNEHDNKYLQEAWNDYGSENMIFSIIEECQPKDRKLIEQKYIDKYNSKDRAYGYNIYNSIGNGFNGSPKEKGSSYRKNGDPDRGENHWNSKYTEDQVLRVIELLKNSTISFSRIAELTETNFYLVSDIWSKNRWKYLTDNIEFPRRTKTVSEAQVKKIVELLNIEKSDTEISNDLNVPQKIVQSIRLGLSWKHITNPEYKRNRLSEDDIILIIHDYNDGKNIIELSNKYGYSYNQIYKLLRRETWSEFTKNIHIEWR